MKIKPTNHHNDVQDTPEYTIELFVLKESSISLRAIKNIQSFIKNQINLTFRLDIIDIHQYPEKAMVNKIIGIPTLIRRTPKPEIRVTGDLSDEKQLAQILII